MQSREFAYKRGEDGEDILADIHWADDTPQGDGHPIALIFHGGGFVTGSKEVIPRAQITVLCRFGFAVVVPNFRLCPQISLYDGPIADSVDCVHWVVSSLPELLQKQNELVRLNTTCIVTIGHSAGAAIALLMASKSTIRISAILDFYGGKYYTDEVWHKPSPFFAEAPLFPESLTSQILHGPQISAAVPAMPKEGVTPEPRDAWLSNAFKTGKHTELVIKDGDYDRIEPSKGFKSGFPPTMFLHGVNDTLTPLSISERAYTELKSQGVETQLVKVEGGNHMFDMYYSGEDDEGFKKWVLPGFEFLASHVNLIVP